MSEIPEGATHKQDVFFYKKECTCWYVYMSGWKPNTVANELRGWAESNLTLIKQDKEMIYTKEMHEAGELPKVGMMVSTEAGEYVVLLINDKEIVFEDEQGFYISINKHKVKPIDTRTDTEKAVDDLADGISASYSNSKSFKEDARELLDLIKAGKIHGVTFTGDNYFGRSINRGVCGYCRSSIHKQKRRREII